MDLAIVNGAGMVTTDHANLPAIRLVVVTRLRLDGDALAALFQAHADFRVLCTTTSTNVAAAVGRHRRPDVVLLGGCLVDDADGQSIASLVHQLGDVPVLVLDIDLNPAHLSAVLNAPRAGYFTRSTPFAELADGIRRLVRGERAFDASITNRIQQTPHGWQVCLGQDLEPTTQLTPREIEVWKLIAQGNSVRHCAELLHLAASTVDNHKSHLMKKLGVHKSLDLTRMAIRDGLVSL